MTPNTGTCADRTSCAPTPPARRPTDQSIESLRDTTAPTVGPHLGQATRRATATSSTVAWPASRWRHERTPSPLSNHDDDSPQRPHRPRALTFARTWTQTLTLGPATTSAAMITTSRGNPQIALSTLLTRTLWLPTCRSLTARSYEEDGVRARTTPGDVTRAGFSRLPDSNPPDRLPKRFADALQTSDFAKRTPPRHDVPVGLRKWRDSRDERCSSPCSFQRCCPGLRLPNPFRHPPFRYRG